MYMASQILDQSDIFPRIRALKTISAWKHIIPPERKKLPLFLERERSKASKVNAVVPDRYSAFV
jgi:hypothetical protein